MKKVNIFIKISVKILKFIDNLAYFAVSGKKRKKTNKTKSTIGIAKGDISDIFRDIHRHGK